MIILLLFLCLFAALLLGFPVAFTLAGVSIIFGYFAFGIDLFYLLPLRIYGTMSSQILISVPLFIYMGVMLEKSGIASRLLNTMAILLGRIRGGLAISVAIVGAMLAASTGIVGATVVTMGLMSLPAMLNRGYSKEYATGIIAASGTLGQIIPPSIVLILMGSVMNISIGNLFIAAVIPGVSLVILYILFVYVYAVIYPDKVPHFSEAEIITYQKELSFRLLFRTFLLPFILIVAVLGSIFLGIASPTEAAGIGALCATLLTKLEGKLTWENIKTAAYESGNLSSMVFMILVGATAFGLVFRGMGGDDFLVELIQNADLSPYMFLAIVMIGIFIAGFFIDFIEIIFIFMPVVTPIFMHYDMNLLWIAILVSLNLQTSFLTPPFGFSLFYLKGVAPESVKTSHIYKGIIPYIVIQIVLISVIIQFPQIVTWLPEFLD
ncbi:TRAP transporter large permease [Flammeovirga agarivorans]|uniref:TRAP transporter large permease subunit n=1 Tax=Flammeovirga agarivorans TaxID=2726742 RepID=A0A7X8SHX7_9BACT|nr:TRAP transporter large permease subunit [Flammeovirga agarivorans]NLR90570.1 TRAP transporter large permease subunit [Flammeovirga agarivorans]